MVDRAWIIAGRYSDLLRSAFIGAVIGLFVVAIIVGPTMFLNFEQPKENPRDQPTEVAPLGSIATVPGSTMNLEQSLTSQLDRVSINQTAPLFSIRWRAPSEYTEPEQSTEYLVLVALMQRLSRLQESPAASNDRAKALFKLMEAEQALLGSELRGDMPSFPGIK